MKLVVQDLDQHYGSAQVLRGVGFTIEPGACMAVLGRNGAGKTTLLRSIVGLLPPSAGSVTFDGADITAWSTHRRSQHGLAYVPQGREIFPELSVRDNIRAAARAHDTERDGATEEALDLFPALKELWGKAGGQLSGGQQQQLAIARALVTRPRLLILDEPTEGIQPSIVKTIEAAIASLKGRMSILLVEQYLDFAIRLADSFVVLSRGTVIEAGSGAAMTHAALSRHIAI
jgi:urea transport system ATP-binding protein